ncbi:MAG TPA: glycosyltransferase family 4 protein, partial [Longimicrobiaceae bacterium]|nr:glycosyltransferase family 4 protein [Longimicrobiaceae bacterium]
RALADERAAVRRARVVIANSRRTGRDAVERLGAAPERVHAVYYGTDPERFRPPSPEERAAARAALGVEGDTSVAVFVGALGDRRKGFDTLFRAWTEVRSAKCEVRSAPVLLVVGTGSELPAWRARAAAEGLGGIRFLGFRGDVREVLRAADLLVSPTRYEAYGLAVQEALCCGLPALVSADAGVAERYPASLHPLLLADPDDAAELRDRLRDVLADPGRYRSAVLALSDELRAWSWDRMAARIVDILEGAA